MLATGFRLIRRAALLAGAAAVLGAGPATAQPQPIPIGAVLPMTGLAATYGTPYLVAVQLGVEEVNRAGGVNGRPLAVTVEDSQASNTVTINAFNRVLQARPVAIMGPGLGTQILAIMPAFEREKVPVFAGPSTRRVTQQGAKWFYRTTSHDAVGKELWTRFIVDDLGKKRVGVLHIANEWGYSGRDNTAAFLKSVYGLEPVSIAAYQAGDRDVTAQLLQMQRDGVEVLVTQGFPVDEALIVRQMRQLNIAIPHIGSGSLCGAFLRNLVTHAEIEGHYCEGPDILPTLNEKPAMQAFVAAYTQRAGFPPDIYATQYYDVVRMLAQVMREHGADREKIRDGFRSAVFEGVMGTYRADAEGNLWTGSAIMQFGPNGTARVVKRLQRAATEAPAAPPQ
jgi:branched-chain amino acid transport system substrate-binding protein